MLIGGAGLFWVNWMGTHFTQFADTEKIILEDDSITLRFSDSSCRGRLAKRDVYSSSVDRDDVWSELYDMWDNRPGSWTLYRAEGSYVAKSHPVTEIKSKIAFDSYPYQYTVLVTNELAVQFPKRACSLKKRVTHLTTR